jgi:hypothetical protein
MTNEHSETFLQATRRTIHQSGLDDFLPTLLLPDREHLVVLEGIPQGEDQAAIARKWASAQAGSGNPYMLAFRVDGTHFAIVRFIGGVLSEDFYASQDA